MKHTDGPWKAIIATAYNSKGEPSSYLAVMSKDATVIDWPDLKPADARLIAAAPELLAKLKLANEMLNHLYKITDDDVPNNVDHGRVRQAIAKAEGV